MKVTYDSTQDHRGAVLAMIASDGTISVISISGDATIDVTPLRSAPAPSEIYSGNDEAVALSAIDAQLQAL